MNTAFWNESFSKYSINTALIWKESKISYGELQKKIDDKIFQLNNLNIQPGEVVGLTGDFSPNTIALLFALIRNNNIIVPLNRSQQEKNKIKLEIAQAERTIEVDVK